MSCVCICLLAEMSGRSAEGLAALGRTRDADSRQLRLVGFHEMCHCGKGLPTMTSCCILMKYHCWMYCVPCFLTPFDFISMCQRLVCILLQSRVIAVLDWELSTLGHPLSDLAHLSLFYFWPRTLPMLNGGSPIQENTGTEEQLPKLPFI